MVAGDGSKKGINEKATSKIVIVVKVSGKTKYDGSGFLSVSGSDSSGKKFGAVFHGNIRPGDSQTNKTLKKEDTRLFQGRHDVTVSRQPPQ
jgi:hypothetical protein